MEHSYIDANNLVDRYVMRQLEPEQSDEFEEHFVDCPRCQDQIEIARDLVAGMRTAGRDQQYARPRLLKSRWSSVLALVAGLFIAGLPSVWFASQALRVGGELKQERTAALEWRRRYEQQIARSSQLSANVPVFHLSAVRGSDSTLKPAATLRLPEPAQPLIFVLENSMAPEYPAYRVTIDSLKSPLFQTGGLQQTSPDALAFSVSSDVIPPGNHSITLEGVMRDGRNVIVGIFAFQAIRPK